jgi:hypothetical protein
MPALITIQIAHQITCQVDPEIKIDYGLGAILLVIIPVCLVFIVHSANTQIRLGWNVGLMDDETVKGRRVIAQKG